MTLYPHWKSRFTNILESILLVLAMLTLLAFCAYLVWGKQGIWLILASFSSLLVVIPNISPNYLMHLYRAEPLDSGNFPFGALLISRLARLADLPTTPHLYHVPSLSLNAFSTGNQNNSAIAITLGMLKALNERELAAVLAHEISHIRNNDIWIISLANLISHLTSVMARVGILLLILNLPFLFGGEISWLLVTLLILSPLISKLMQLTLSRIREYGADLFAVSLTNDPQGLAQALQKIDYIEGRLWKYLFYPRKRTPGPSILLTHPPTKQRVDRLLALKK